MSSIELCSQQFAKMSTGPKVVFLASVLLLVCTKQTSAQVAQQYTHVYPPRVIESSEGTCPSEEEREAVRGEIKQDITRLLTSYDKTCGGTGGWALHTHINMTNSSHQCPGDFREVTYSGVRLCARDESSINPDPDLFRRCTSVLFPSNATAYSAVCGRVIGYQYGGTSGFEIYNRRNNPDNTIDGVYVDGLTLTHGPVGSREHIWTFATARAEFNTDNACPCNAQLSRLTPPVPPFIGDDYFCESGAYNWPGYVFLNEPLWDGMGCVAENLCCDFSNPPYFSRQLPAMTTDDIELRDCGGRGVGTGYSYPSDTLIQMVELYIK